MKMNLDYNSNKKWSMLNIMHVLNTFTYFWTLKKNAFNFMHATAGGFGRNGLSVLYYK
jgi:hypothetical protein